MTEFQPPAMTGLARFTSGSITARDGQITSADPHDGTPIAVTVCGGAWSWIPAGTVVVAGRATGCGTVQTPPSRAPGQRL